MIHQQIQKEIIALKNDAQAKILQGFFKTGKGEYGYGDKFLGVKVPVTRSVVKKYYNNATIKDAQRLLASKYHEVRLAGVLILVYLYERNPKLVFTRYLQNVGVKKGINNWDLVDVSAYHIVGHYVTHHMTKKEACDFYDTLSSSHDLWKKRVAIVSTFYSIKQGNPIPTFVIAQKYLTDTHDLIHKATGWMLREVGKRVGETHLIKFLHRHKSNMPKIMYRYAIERIKNPPR